MKCIIFATLLALAAADTRSYSAPSAESVEQVAILRDDRVSPEGGSYSFDVETGNGISISEQGEAIDSGSAEGAVASTGSISFTLPNGEQFEMTYVADENGFQPQSSFLPVAPAFPHPIPDFVLEQIEKARLEDLADSSEEAPSTGYGAP